MATTTTDTVAPGLLAFPAAPEFIQGMVHLLTDTLNTTETLHDPQWHSEGRALQETPRMKESYWYLLIVVGTVCFFIFLHYW